MALVDSEAAFSQRCKEIDAEGLRTQLASQGLPTFASLPMLVGPRRKDLLQVSLMRFGAAPRLGDVSLLKRLMFEAAVRIQRGTAPLARGRESRSRNRTNASLSWSEP